MKLEKGSKLVHHCGEGHCGCIAGDGAVYTTTGRHIGSLVEVKSQRGDTHYIGDDVVRTGRYVLEEK